MDTNDLDQEGTPLEDFEEAFPPFDKIFQAFIIDNTPLLRPPSRSCQTLFSEKISIRIPHHVLSAVKKKAAAVGVPYQTLINQVLMEHAKH